MQKAIKPGIFDELRGFKLKPKIVGRTRISINCNIKAPLTMSITQHFEMYCCSERALAPTAQSEEATAILIALRHHTYCELF